MRSFISSLFIMAFVIAPSYGMAQQKIVYLDNMEYKTDSAHAKYYLFYTKDSNLYKVKKFRLSDDELIMKGYSLSSDTLCCTGKFTFYKNGFKSSEGIYENNRRTGEWKNYYDTSDKVWYIESYDAGVVKKLTSYYKDGNVSRKEYRLDDGEATGKCYDESGNEIRFTSFESMPVFAYNFDEYIGKTIRYPEDARERNIHGRVIVQFVVDTDGSISDVKIVKGIGGGCNEEAIRVISSMPKWLPGSLDNKPTKVYFTKSINFTLQ